MHHKRQFKRNMTCYQHRYRFGMIQILDANTGGKRDVVRRKGRFMKRYFAVLLKYYRWRFKIPLHLAENLAKEIDKQLTVYQFQMRVSGHIQVYCLISCDINSLYSLGVF